GQRIDSLEVDAWLNGAWQKVAAANSIGSNRLLRLPAKITTDRIRVRVVASPVCPALSTVSLYRQSPLVATLQQQALQKEKQAGKDRNSSAGSWQVVFPTKDEAVAHITDDQPETVWNAPTAGTAEVQLDAGKVRTVLGIEYLPPA